MINSFFVANQSFRRHLFVYWPGHTNPRTLSGTLFRTCNEHFRIVGNKSLKCAFMFRVVFWTLFWGQCVQVSIRITYLRPDRHNLLDSCLERRYPRKGCCSSMGLWPNQKCACAVSASQPTGNHITCFPEVSLYTVTMSGCQQCSYSYFGETSTFVTKTIVFCIVWDLTVLLPQVWSFVHLVWLRL